MKPARQGQEPRLKRVLLLALPLALLLVPAVWLRVMFYRAFPEPFTSPDTLSYLSGPFGLLLRGDFDLSSARTPGFPLLVAVVLASAGSFHALMVAQGLLTVVSAVAAFLFMRRFAGEGPRWPALLATALLAINAHLLFWEHQLLTEAAYSAALTFALCGTAAAIRRPTPLLAGAAGALAAFSVLVRPQGLFVVGLVIAAVVWNARAMGRQRLLRVAVCALLGPVLLLGGWSLRNQLRHGYFGLTDITGLVFFGVSARWVDLHRPTHSEARRAIAGSIARYQAMPDNVNFIQYSADGAAAAIYRVHGGDRNAADATMRALARETILAHPLEFVRRGATVTWTLATATPHWWQCDFACAARWEENWSTLKPHLPVDRYRVPIPPEAAAGRAAVFNRWVQPFFSTETWFIRLTMVSIVLSLASLALLDPQRRLFVSVAASSALMLLVSAGFLSEPAERYLAVLHAPATMALAVAVAGILERVRRRRGP